MSTTYPYYSNNFPDDIDNFDQFRDPRDSEMYLINQYYYFLDNNMLDQAKGILTDNPDLKEVIVNADRLNLLRDSLLSIEEYYRDNIQNLDNVFIATYGTAGQQGVTTSAEIEEAYQAGKACFCVYGGRCYALSRRVDSTNHYFSVFYNQTRYTVHCANNDWSIGATDFASSSDLTSGLATKQDTLPSQTSNAGKFLTTNGSALSWGSVPDNVFIAVYDNTNGTTHAEIEAAVNAKKFVYCYWSDRLYSLAYKDTTSNTFYFYAWRGSVKYQITCNTSNQWSNTSTTYSTSSHTHNTYAPINSPNFTGIPKTVDIDANSPSNQIANKAYVDAHSGGNGVYFVDYGTTTTGMIDAYNAGKLVITSFGNSFCYLMYSNDVQYYFYSIDCDINSVYNSSFYHRFIECVATYDSSTQTLSWESASYPVHNTYEAVYGDTTQDGFLNLGVCYSRKYCIYCYYNNKIYYLTNKSEDSNQVSYYFTNINNGVQSTVICTKNSSNNTISWSYNTTPFTTNVYIATCPISPTSNEITILRDAIYSAVQAGKVVCLQYNNHIYNLGTIPATISDDMYFFRATYKTYTGDASNYPTVDRVLITTTAVSNNYTVGATKDSVTALDKIFVATYGTTTYNEITTAVGQNKLIVLYSTNLTNTHNPTFIMTNKITVTSTGVSHDAYQFVAVREKNLVYAWCLDNDIWDTGGSTNLATQTDLTNGLATKQDTLTFDNSPTSGSNNPVKSGGVYTSLSGKLDKSGGTMTGALTLSGAPIANLHAATKKYVDDGLALKAPLNSPEFTGTPTAPTVPNPLSNTTNLATTAFVQKAIGANIFVAEYNVTSFEDIAEAIVVNGCNFIICKRNAGSNGYEYYYCQTIDLDNNSIVFNNIFGGGSANFKRIECSWYENITTWSESVNQTLVYS